jgi:CheY-like chemotaxis protein
MPGSNINLFYIVLAEDNPHDVFLLRQALDQERLDYALCVAKDGQEALALLRHEGDFSGAGNPDLILLDLNLPKHDGKEILRTIRAMPSLRQVPIAVFTSSRNPADEAETRRLGATSFISKPTNLDEFLAVGARIRALLASPPQSSVLNGPH